MHTRTVVALLALAAGIAGCDAPPAADQAATRQPQQAGQPMDPLRTAGHMAGVRAAAISGDQQGVQRHMDAMNEDMRRAMKLADPARPIDREAARAIARALPGVRSAVWIDRGNLLVRVEGAAMRTQQTIDELCYRLEPLGDTLAVVVHLQDAAPTSRAGMDTLSRTCQLAPGDHAMLQRDRRMDVLDPAVRAEHEATMERMRSQPQHVQTAGDRAAIEAMPEM